MTGAAQAAAQSPKATQVGYSPSQAIDRTPVNKSAFEKIKDDFLMDMGFKNKDADYYRRLDDRSDAAKKEQERKKESYNCTVWTRKKKEGVASATFL